MYDYCFYQSFHYVQLFGYVRLLFFPKQSTMYGYSDMYLYSEPHSTIQDEYPGFAPESFSEKICNAADIRINELCIYNIGSLLLYTVLAEFTPKPTIK